MEQQTVSVAMPGLTLFFWIISLNYWDYVFCWMIFQNFGNVIIWWTYITIWGIIVIKICETKSHLHVVFWETSKYDYYSIQTWQSHAKSVKQEEFSVRTIGYMAKSWRSAGIFFPVTGCRKSGIVCSLNARTAILASANPADSCYNPKLSAPQLKSAVLLRIWQILQSEYKRYLGQL